MNKKLRRTTFFDRVFGESASSGAALDAKRLGARAGVSERTARRWCRQGGLDAIKVGGQWIVFAGLGFDAAVDALKAKKGRPRLNLSNRPASATRLGDKKKRQKREKRGSGL